MKDLFEIVKKHHRYYNENPDSSVFMCLAAEDAMIENEISKEEFIETLSQIKEWMMEIDEKTRKEIKDNDLDDLPSLATCLGLCPYFHIKEVKQWWDSRISSL